MMKQKLLLLILLLVLTYLPALHAQSSWPPVFEIKTDTTFTQFLDPSFWQTIEDKEGKWTIADVSVPPLSEKFHRKGTNAAGIDTTDIHTYWQRYRLKNTMNKEARVSLISYSEYFDVFVFSKDSLLGHYKSGFQRKWDERDGLKAANEKSEIKPGAIPLIIAQGEEITVYDRRHRSDFKNFAVNVRIVNTDSLIQKNYISYVDSRTNYYSSLHLQEAFLIGILFVTIFLSLFFYRYIHENIYLNFALFALFLSINRTSNILHDYTVWNHAGLIESTKMVGYAWAFIPFFLINFFRNYLDTKHTRPQWDKILYGVAIINLAIGLLGIVLELISGERIQFLGAAQGIMH